jgi:hypothetical protein
MVAWLMHLGRASWPQEDVEEAVYLMLERKQRGRDGDQV